MPAAAPVPRHPGALVMDGPAALLTAPGCPVCRYVSEASDRHLTWFALNGHADETIVGRLTASLGPCARHTRRLMGQPGAAVRLTAFYRYILRNARDRLSGRATAILPCPMCAHEQAAAARALETLLASLSDAAFLQRCRQLGGLCVPHLSAAATMCPTSAAWFAETLAMTLAGRDARIWWVAGDFDHDAEARGGLRRLVPERLSAGSCGCPVCLAGARAEESAIARLADLSGKRRLQEDPELLLCRSHLGDAAIFAGQTDRLRQLLSWQARSHIGAITPLRVTRRWLRIVRRPGELPCAGCHARETAVQMGLDDIRRNLRTPSSASAPHGMACVRHILLLRSIDPRAAHVSIPHGIKVTETVLAELADAFLVCTGPRGRVPSGPQMNAWRRAAALLDGAVFCGGPIPRLARRSEAAAYPWAA